MFFKVPYPLLQKIIKTIINITSMINNKKNPVFDSIFSVEPKTLHDTTPMFDLLFSLFIWVNNSLIWVSLYKKDISLFILHSHATLELFFSYSKKIQFFSHKDILFILKLFFLSYKLISVPDSDLYVLHGSLYNSLSGSCWLISASSISIGM